MNPIHTLVIACGNPLRGDDAVAHVAADSVEAWQTPGVKVCRVHQLVPELIDEMKGVRKVLFLDAGINSCPGQFAAGEVEPKFSRRSLGHCESPANLLALLQELHGRVPRATLLAISVCSFGFGHALTEIAQGNLQAAIEWIKEFLAELPGSNEEVRDQGTFDSILPTYDLRLG